MWTCPKCNRRFKTMHQSHSCTQLDAGELFFGKSDELVQAYDAIVQATKTWSPNSIGTAKHTIVFTSTKAWLIIKPMKKGLEVKFYYNSPIDSERFSKITSFYGKFVHYILLQSPEEVDQEFIKLIRKGYDYTIEGVLQ